jgi:hypothetical protein
VKGKWQHSGLNDDWNTYQLTDGAEWLIALLKMNSNSEMPTVMSCSPLITPTHCSGCLICVN